jgi:hypothetical protein
VFLPVPIVRVVWGIRDNHNIIAAVTATPTSSDSALDCVRTPAPKSPPTAAVASPTTLAISDVAVPNAPAAPDVMSPATLPTAEVASLKPLTVSEVMTSLTLLTAEAATLAALPMAEVAELKLLPPAEPELVVLAELEEASARWERAQRGLSQDVGYCTNLCHRGGTSIDREDRQEGDSDKGESH